MKIEEIRKKIDKINLEILRLLNERILLVDEIGKAKKNNNIQILDISREESIINSILQNNKHFPEEELKNIFYEIFKASLSREKILNISYLGPKFSFSYLAANKRFGNKCNYIEANSIYDIFKDVETGRCDYGIVPVENSNEGSISMTMDCFLKSSVLVQGELLLNVSQNLLSKEKSLDKIKVIYSHSQPFAQAQNWLRKNFKKVKLVEVSSTAEAARIAAKQKNSGAIASELAAEYYKLNILVRNIEDNPENITRFFIIGKGYNKPSQKDKTSIIFNVKDTYGALYKALEPFYKNKINLKKIESRPSKVKAWEYVFFVDLEGHIENKKVKNALKNLEDKCKFIKILGSYPAAY
ncbi:MAG TPA: prephenate dehydratase [bacterium]|nr:prephenate dehydratase [bacterium]HOL47738.1 prephenate dehydratase [bacterium]HPQ18028.1 prephenate dehydratase [bacterium]